MPVHCVIAVLAEICLAQLNEISRGFFPGKSWKKTLKDFIWLPPGDFIWLPPGDFIHLEGRDGGSISTSISSPTSGEKVLQ